MLILKLQLHITNPQNVAFNNITDKFVSGEIV